MSQTANQAANPLGTEPIGKLLVRYAVPSIISMVIMSIYNIVDQIFIGWGVGYLGNAATTVAFPVITLGVALALVCGVGCAASCNLEMGKGNYDKVGKTVGTSLTMVVVFGLALTALILVFLQPLLRLMGSNDEVMPYAIEYTQVIAMGMPFAMLSPALGHIIRSDGSPRYSMIATMAGAVLNIILDPIFIFVFDMGVRGAAIATVISQIVSAVLALWYVARMTRNYTLSASMLRPRFDLGRKVLAFGSSSFVTQIAIVILNVVLNNSLTHYGAMSEYGAEIPLAAMGIVLKINAILISAILGVAIGAQPILGFNYGARNFDRVRKTYKTEVAFCMALSVVFWVLFLTVPELFVSIFGDEDPMFNTFAALALRIYMSGIFCAGMQIPSANYFQAVGKPMVAMTLTLCRQLLFLVSFIVILPRFFGLMGILYAGPAGDVLAVCVTSVFIFRELRRLGAGSADQPVAVPDSVAAERGV